MALRLSVLKFAEHLGVGSRTVSDWEAGGAQIVPSPVMQETLDTALSRACDEVKIRFVELTSGSPAVCVPDSPGHNGNGEHTDRRQAGKAIVMGGFTAALAPLETLERIIHHRDRPVDAELIGDHEDFADTLARMHFATRPEVLVGPVAQQADMVVRLLDRDLSETMRRRVDEIAVGLCAQAGTLAFLGGDRVAARSCFALARAIADDSRNDLLRAQALTFGSVLYSPIPTGGRGGDTRLSIPILQEAIHYLGGAAPSFGALAHRWLGQELAVVGNERGFHQAMETAGHLAGQPSHHDGRGIFARYAAALNGPNGTARDVGVGCVLLGHAEQAVDMLSTVRAGGNPRRNVTVLTEIAAARVIQGEPEQACQDLQDALDLAFDAGYPMGVERIRGVRDRFPEPWAELPCVRELDERLRAAA
jgi:hypothetical protein